MVSVNYIASNAAALASLRQINSQLQTTQNRIATGLKVASASDDATAWNAANTLRREVRTNETLTSGIASKKGTLDTAKAGLDTTSTLLTKLSDLLTTASSSGSPDYVSLTAQVKAIQTQIVNAVNSAKSDGANILNAATAVAVTIGYDASGAAITSTLAASNLLAAATNLTVATTAPGSTLDASAVTTLLGKVTSAMTDVSARSAEISTFASAVDTQVDLLKKINSIRNQAISALVDADMEEESAKAQALQVKQQLAYQALSMSNASVSNVLRLFQ